jgi:hypothetical protein
MEGDMRDDICDMLRAWYLRIQGGAVPAAETENNQRLSPLDNEAFRRSPRAQTIDGKSRIHNIASFLSDAARIARRPQVSKIDAEDFCNDSFPCISINSLFQTLPLFHL